MSARSSFPKARGSRFLPLFTLAILAAIGVASLVFWNLQPAPAPPKLAAKAPSPTEPLSQGESGSHGKPGLRPHAQAPAENAPARIPETPHTSQTVRPPAGVSHVAKPAGSPPEPSSWKDMPEPEPLPTPPPLPKETAPSHLALHQPAPSPPPLPEPLLPSVPAPPLGKVAIVIDDFGQSLESARQFLDLPIPITFSILPYQPHSREIAQLAHAQHREVILHLPMEPEGYPRVNPGSGALLGTMSESRLHSSLLAALDASPYISGLNNHMGSRFTTNAAGMKLVLAECRRRGLYFLDSYTTPQSVGYALAQELHVPSRRRDVFLDHNPTEAAIRSQIKLLLRKARIEGSAVAIGHPHDATLHVLREALEQFQREEIAVVPSSALMIGTPQTAEEKKD